MKGRFSSASVFSVSFGTPNVPTLRSEHADSATGIGAGSAGPVASAVRIAGCADTKLRFVPCASALYIHVWGKKPGMLNGLPASEAFVALEGAKNRRDTVQPA